MKKLLIITLLSSIATCAFAKKQETVEKYLELEKAMYEQAKKYKDAPHDNFHREWIRVVRENYKQTWWDHHPVATTVLQVFGVSVVIFLIVCAQAAGEEARRGQGGNRRGNDGGNNVRHGRGNDNDIELIDMRPQEDPIEGRNPALLGDPRYAHLPRPRLVDAHPAQNPAFAGQAHHINDNARPEGQLPPPYEPDPVFQDPAGQA